MEWKRKGGREKLEGLSNLHPSQSQPRLLTVISIPKYFPSLAGLLFRNVLSFCRPPICNLGRQLHLVCPSFQANIPSPPVSTSTLESSLVLIYFWHSPASPLISFSHLILNRLPLLNANEQRKVADLTKCSRQAFCQASYIWTDAFTVPPHRWNCQVQPRREATIKLSRTIAGVFSSHGAVEGWGTLMPRHGHRLW